MAGGQQLPEQYTVPQYARIFHSLPHLNVSLHSVNNTFNPHSEIYLEVGSLGTNPSIPTSLAPIVIPDCTPFACSHHGVRKIDLMDLNKYSLIPVSTSILEHQNFPAVIPRDILLTTTNANGTLDYRLWSAGEVGFALPGLQREKRKKRFTCPWKVAGHGEDTGKRGRSYETASLGILGSIPAAWLILTLLVLLVYLVTRCCDRRPRPKKSITALKFSLAILALLCSGAVAVGLYGNDDVHNGLVQLIAAAKNVDGILMGVRNQTDTIEATLKRKVQPQLTALGDEFDAPVSNKTMLSWLLAALNGMKQNTSIAVNRSFEIRKPLSGISLAGAIGMGEKIEQLRWPITMAVLSALLVLCVVLVVGVARHSRCVLITFSVFGLFAVIVSWLMASLYLATSVALGDLCVSPDGYLSRAVPSTLASEVLSYYTHCENTRSNPFTLRLRDTQRAVDNMRHNLNTVTKLALELFKDQQLQPKLSSLSTDVNTIDRLMPGLSTLLDCKPLHKQYVHAAKSLCHLGLYGLSFMLIASLAAGLLFTVLVWVDSHTWIYIRKRRDYHQVDEQDPYLPPSAASQAIAARTLRGQGSYPPTAPMLNSNALGTHNTIKQPLLLTPPPPSYATATARARQLHESMLKGGGVNGSGGGGDHKSSQHNQQSTGGRTEHRSGLGDQPGQYATLSKQCKTLESSREPPWTPSVASFTGTLSHNSHGPAHLATFQDSRKTQTLDPKNLANLKRGPTQAWNQNRPLPPNPASQQPTWEFESRSQTNMNQFRSLVRNKAPNIRIQDQMQDQVRTLDRNFSRSQFNGTTPQNNTVPNMYGTYNRAQGRQEKPTVATLSQVQGSDPNLYAVTEL
ncbi:Protein tweety [Cyphomyrmex costatus]|uniref:Protein tweety homolog n=1 Tax=Cyphomyrmex costatus TaxID=456900 RepID=A0A151IPA6_9HYME|nr:Protein tweety [Cyphomyrmex costatus]